MHASLQPEVCLHSQKPTRVLEAQSSSQELVTWLSWPARTHTHTKYQVPIMNTTVYFKQCFRLVYTDPLSCGYRIASLIREHWKSSAQNLVKGIMMSLSILKISTEKAMAPHSSTLAWKIPWTEEPGGLPSLWSHRVGHNWSDLAAAAEISKEGVKQTSYVNSFLAEVLANHVGCSYKWSLTVIKLSDRSQSCIS